MEEINLYDKWLERIRVSIQKAINKREDRRLRNLKQKANGGHNVLTRNLQSGQSRD